MRSFPSVLGFLIGLLLGAGVPSAAIGQQNGNLFFARSVPQSIYTNPAFIPHYRTNISVPGVGSFSSSLSNSGFRYNDAIRFQEEGDSLELTMDRALKALSDKNYLTFTARNDWFHGGITLGKNYLTLNVSDRLRTRFTYPEEFIRLLWEGNGGQFLGERVDLSDLSLDHVYYREYGAGIARKINEKTTLGVRMKYLQGLQNFRTEKSLLGLHTNEETFGWTVDGEVEANTSGLRKFWEGDSSVAPTDVLFVQGNHGFSTDIGLESQVSDRSTFSLALTDVGFIRWSQNVRNYKSNDVAFTYEGVDLLNVFDDQDTTLENAKETLEDSLNNAFTIKERGQEYSTPLTADLRAGFSLDVWKLTTLGAMGRLTFVRGERRGGLTLHFRHHNQEGLWLMGSYSIHDRSADNLGAGISMRIGPVQWHLILNNALAPFRPHKVKSAHIRTGLNLTFGPSEDDPYHQVKEEGEGSEKGDKSEGQGDKETGGQGG